MGYLLENSPAIYPSDLGKFTVRNFVWNEKDATKMYLLADRYLQRLKQTGPPPSPISNAAEWYEGSAENFMAKMKTRFPGIGIESAEDNRRSNLLTVTEFRHPEVELTEKRSIWNFSNNTIAHAGGSVWFLGNRSNIYRMDLAVPGKTEEILMPSENRHQ